MDLNFFLTYLSPVAVFLATFFVTKIKTSIPGIVLVGVVVPLISMLAAYIASITGSTVGFFPQLLINLAAVFVNEFIVQLKQANAAKAAVDGTSTK